MSPHSSSPSSPRARGAKCAWNRENAESRDPEPVPQFNNRFFSKTTRSAQQHGSGRERVWPEFWGRTRGQTAGPAPTAPLVLDGSSPAGGTTGWRGRYAGTSRDAAPAADSRASSWVSQVTPSHATAGTPAAEAQRTDPPGPQTRKTRKHTKAGSAPPPACGGASLGPGRSRLSVVLQARWTSGTGPRQTPDGSPGVGACTPARGSKMSQKEKNGARIQNSPVGENVHFTCIRACVSAEGLERDVVLDLAGFPQRRSKRGLEKLLSCAGSPGDS